MTAAPPGEGERRSANHKEESVVISKGANDKVDDEGGKGKVGNERKKQTGLGGTESSATD